jgi:hypothetical protein
MLVDGQTVGNMRRRTHEGRDNILDEISRLYLEFLIVRIRSRKREGTLTGLCIALCGC